MDYLIGSQGQAVVQARKAGEQEYRKRGNSLREEAGIVPVVEVREKVAHLVHWESIRHWDCFELLECMT